MADRSNPDPERRTQPAKLRGCPLVCERDRVPSQGYLSQDLSCSVSHASFCWSGMRWHPFPRVARCVRVLLVGLRGWVPPPACRWRPGRSATRRFVALLDAGNFSHGERDEALCDLRDALAAVTVGDDASALELPIVRARWSRRPTGLRACTWTVTGVSWCRRASAASPGSRVLASLQDAGEMVAANVPPPQPPSRLRRLGARVMGSRA